MIRSGLMLLVLIMAMCSGAWGACQSIDKLTGNQGTSYCSSNTINRNYSQCKRSLNYRSVNECTQTNCTANLEVNIQGGSSGWLYCNVSGGFIGCSGYQSIVDINIIACETQCEADSIGCINEGKSWNSAKCECEVCKSDSTWFSDSSCVLSGSTGKYLNSYVKHQIKDCEELPEIEIKFWSTSCDTIQDSTYDCIGTVNGSTVMMKAPNGATFNCEADGSCSRAMQMIASGECKPPSSRPPTPLSSASEPTSSSEGEPTSSSSEGEPSSSGGGDEGSSDSEGGQHVIVDDLPQRLYDSLGNIDQNIEWFQPFVSGLYDATWDISGTTHDINQNTRTTADNTAGILEKSQNIDNKITTTNSLLTDIKNKNWSPNINVQPPQVNVENNTDVNGIQNRQDQTRDTLHNTNSLLEQILGWVSKGVTMDSFKQTFNVDSSGWGRLSEEISDAGDSLINQYGGIMAINNCDTTGGHRCDNAIIGVGGLDSAKKGAKSVYGELRDSMTHGAFMDSLNNWGSAFTGEGVLEGSGSNNCPSFLSRTHTITIGNSTAEMRLDGVLCATLFGNVTPWTLARVLIRSIVAFFCMVALFKAATGTMFTSEDE